MLNKFDLNQIDEHDTQFPMGAPRQPVRFYIWLRIKHNYSPKSAGISTLATFCKSDADYHRRLHRSFDRK